MASDVSVMKLPELQRYLKIRGISTTNLNKPQLIDLCKAVETINLPTDPDFLTCKDEDRPLSPGSLYGISDPFALNNFTADLTRIPDISLYDVFNFLINKTSTYDKRKLKAYKSCEEYRLYFDGHVQELQFSEVKPSSDVCVFRAKVKPTQKDMTYLAKQTYDVWIIAGKHLGDVKMAYCTCIGGADGACRHIGATLYEIEAFEVKSVTDGNNLWVKRPRQHDCPVSIDQLKVMKARYNNPVPDYQQSSVQSFDPRCLNHRQDYSEAEVSDIARSLREVSPNLQALDVLEVDAPSSTTDVEMEDQEAACSNCSSFIVSNVLRDTDTPEIFVDRMSLTLKNECIEHIESCTVKQSLSSNWHDLRKGRITASNFSKVCKAVDAERCPPSLLKSLLGEYGECSAPSLSWGQKKEKTALQLYMRVCNKTHLHPHLSCRGLRLHQTMPFIGCSVDGVFSCKCHTDKLIEVKCPFTSREENPKDVCLQKGCTYDENGKIIVTEKSDYYHQIQGQMGVYGIQQSDLILYTKKGICVAHAEFDEEFFQSMLSKLGTFFRQYLVCALFK